MPIPLRSLLLATAGTAASLALPVGALAQAPGAVPTITPATCVERAQTGVEGTSSVLRAHFWYDRSADAVALDIPRGADNDLTPADTQLLWETAVPEHFTAQGAYAFSTELGAEPISWTLRDPQTGEGGVAQATSGYASRCIDAELTAAPDPDPAKPSGSTVRIAWNAAISGVEDFRAPDAPPVPWSAWREFQGEAALEAKCTLDELAVPCDEAEVVLTDLAPGAHRFRVLAHPPLPADIGPAAGDAEHLGAFLLVAEFTVAAPAPVESEPEPEPTATPTPTPTGTAPVAPGPSETSAPVQPQLPLDTQPVTPAPSADPAACTKRKLTVVVPKRGRQRIVSARVTVDGKRVAVKKRRGRHIATVAPRRLAREVAVVKIKVRYSNGSRKRITKRIGTCA